jgi:beta-N-acetylglucosaminidase
MADALGAIDPTLQPIRGAALMPLAAPSSVPGGTPGAGAPLEATSASQAAAPAGRDATASAPVPPAVHDSVTVSAEAAEHTSAGAGSAAGHEAAYEHPLAQSLVSYRSSAEGHVSPAPQAGSATTSSAGSAQGAAPAGAQGGAHAAFDSSGAPMQMSMGLVKADDKVKELQRTLSRVGFNVGDADGRFGQRTSEAVKAFQRHNGLQADGVVGPKTMEALNRVGTDPAKAVAQANQDPHDAKGKPSNAEPSASRAAATTHVDAAQQASSHVDAAQQASSPTQPLSERDQKMADFLTQHIHKHGAQGLPHNIGETIVRAANKHNADPLAVAAIPGLETQWGKTGIGAKGMAGVGAYDANPRNAVHNPAFSGVDKQIDGAAKAFVKNRDRFGGSASQPIKDQLKAANGNGHGYASARDWWSKVHSVYQSLQQAAQQAGL